MKQLSDRFAVDAKPTAEQIKHEQTRKLETYFEKRAREIVPIVILKERKPLNPLADKLGGIKV